MAANPYNFEFKRAKAELDACAWPNTTEESDAPHFWRAGRTLFQIRYEKARICESISQEVFTLYPADAVIGLAIMGMKMELSSYDGSPPSSWALHKLSHALLGLNNISKGEKDSLKSFLNCSAVVPTLRQDENSFLWVILEEYLIQEAREKMRGKYLDSSLSKDAAHDAWLHVRVHVKEFRGEAKSGTREAKFSAWILKIVAHQVINYWRKQRGLMPLPDDEKVVADVEGIFGLEGISLERDAFTELEKSILNAMLAEVERRFSKVPHYNHRKLVKANRILRAFRGSEKDGIAHDISAMLADRGIGISLAAIADLIEYIAVCIEERLEQAKGNGKAM